MCFRVIVVRVLADGEDGADDDASSTHSAASTHTERIVEHSTYAHAQIRGIEEKLANKTQALSALKYTHKNDSKACLFPILLLHVLHI